MNIDITHVNCKQKIFKNKNVLRGTKFKAMLNDSYYNFTIMWVNNNEICIHNSINFKNIDSYKFGSLQYLVKNIIIENCVDDDLLLSKKAFSSRTKLKEIPIVYAGCNFKFAQITNSGIKLELVIDIDDLLKNEDNSFIGDVKNVVLNNLLENPPVEKKEKYYSNSISYYDSDFVFYRFTPVGSRQKIISDEELERNRVKNAEINKEEKRKREKGRKLKEELQLNKRLDTKSLARIR